MHWRCFRYEIVDSTSDRAFDALESGDGRHGDVFISETQLAGRGTRGRRWASEPGGLYMSVILESPSIPLPGLWTIAGALAAHDAATRFGASVGLDWPNDVIAQNGAKLAGVLAESRGLQPGGAAVFVLGIGMNVIGHVPEEQLDRKRQVVTLEEIGCDVTKEALELILLAALEVRVLQAADAPETLYADFYARCVQGGHDVILEVGETTVTGRLEGLTPDACLRILDPDTGDHQRVSIAHVRKMRLKDSADATES
ncbi:MAG: BirA family biotin operon repressor/biotin-[acetyl-CoA-carboxylase] ligase [Paracoccaceae bacterium]|jgi:BirA family biotin operon repressor/biotin-[acetyl-CoA-carboxylase] ligase